MKEQLLAGAGKAKIDFQPDDFPLKAFDGEHDPLHVRTVILQESERIALISLELTSLPQGAVMRLKRYVGQLTGIKEDNILISVTHTFSAPHIPPQIRNEEEQRLHDILYLRIEDAVRSAISQALENTEAVTAEQKEVSCGINVNRNILTHRGYWLGRNEDGYSDKTVRIVSLNAGNKVKAVLFNYDIQPSVMDKVKTRDGKQLLSSDLAGAAAAKLEEYIGNGAAAVFLPGCAGDQAPVLKGRQMDIDGRETDIHEDGYLLVRQLGDYLAERIKQALKDSGYKEGERDFVKTGLSIRRYPLKLPKQNMKYPTKELTPHREYRFEPAEGAIDICIIIVSVGEIDLLLSQPELNSGFGSRIRKQCGKNIVIGSLVDGGVKYLPEETDFEHITYAAMNTEIGRGADRRFLEKVKEIWERRR